MFQLSILRKDRAARAGATAAWRGVAVLLWLTIAMVDAVGPSAAADGIGHAIFAPETGSEFVETIGSHTLAEIEGYVDDPEGLEDRLKVLVKLYFDVPAIARATVGDAAWNEASEARRAAFMDAYETYAIELYASYFEKASGEFRVSSESRVGEKDLVVSSTLERPNASDLDVKWRVRERPDGFAILDLVIQGVSVSEVQRDEFETVLRRRGRSLPTLTRAIEDLIWARRSGD